MWLSGRTKDEQEIEQLESLLVFITKSNNSYVNALDQCLGSYCINYLGRSNNSMVIPIREHDN